MIKNTGAVVVPHPGSATNDALADIRDIRPLVDVPLGWEWLTWTVTTLIGVFILRKLWLLWQNRPPASERGPRVSPEQKAHQQLDAALRLLQEPKLFCSTVSDAVRIYLEDRFAFRAPERTTDEFLLELQQSHRLNEGQKKSLAGFLEQCDLVKFARFEPAETELKQLHSVAHQLVDETRPQTLAESLAPTMEPDQAAKHREAAMAEAQRLDGLFVRFLILAIVIFGVGLQMFAWSDVAFASEPMISQKGIGWHTFRYMGEALWSKPVAVALMVLGVVYFIEATLCKARRPRI